MSFNIHISKPAAASVDPRPAAKHFDIILGLDFHLLLIPPSPAPIPFPVIPFGALVFDPMDYIHVTLPAMPAYSKDKGFHIERGPEGKGIKMGGTVLINGFYRAAATSGLMGMPPTMPPILGKVKALGSVVAKLSPLHMVVPKPNFYIPFLAPHDGQVSHGSKTVITQGSEQSTLACQVFSCAHVGRVVLNNPMGLFNNFATAIIAVLPMGKPVMVGGEKVEHKFTTDDLINALMFMGIMAAAKFVLKMLGKLLTKLNKFLCEKFPKFRKIGNAIQPLICKFLGEPVDAGTGHMTSFLKGFSLPGPIPFTWEANYYSDSTYDGPLGKNIYHSYDISLIIEKEEGCVVMNDTAGRAVAFPTLDPGESFYNPAEKFELHRNAEGEYYVSGNGGLFYYFNQRPDRKGYYNLRSIANRNGYAIRFTYNQRHLLEQITDSAGRIIQVANNEQGRITALRLQHPDHEHSTFTPVRYEYDADGCLTAFYDAEGYANSLRWHHRHIIARTFADGTTFTFEYNKEGKCTAALGPEGLYSYRFDYFDNHTVATNSLGHKSTYFHNKGIVNRIVNPEGGQRFFTYDNYNNLLAETDENGITKSFSYDERGNLTTATLPGSGALQTTYNFLNKPIKTVLPNGATWSYEYDESGNLIKRTNPEGVVTTYEYSDGLVTAITNDAGATTQLQYDRYFNLQKIRLPNELEIQYRHDTLGRCLAIQHANGISQHRSYDLLGNIVRIQEPDGNVRVIAYDAMGNPVQATDKHYNIRYAYNFFGDITRRTQGGTSVAFYYNTEGQLTSVENERQELYQFELDACGNVKTERGFDGIARHYVRDAGGRVVQVQHGGGKTTGYDYNSAGRIVKIVHENGRTESYAYDALGDMLKAENETATVTFTRDIMGRVVGENCNGHEVLKKYNVYGNQTQLQSSLGADIQLHYNGLQGWADKITANGWETVMQRNVWGQVTQRNIAGNIEQHFEYDEMGRLTKQSLRQANGISHQRQYTWDVDYRLKALNDSDTGTKLFRHDVHGNLAEVIYGNGTTEYRMPDAVGNLFQTKERADRRYGKGGKLLESKTARYRYDEEGNLIEKKKKNGERWHYDWNEGGMLEKVIRPDGFEVRFGYDALGRRLWKQFKNTITKWLWDGNVPLHEWKEHVVTGEKLSDTTVPEDGVITWVFEKDSFVPAAKVKGVKKYSIITDHLGTPFKMYGEDGNKFWESELDSYGNVRMLKGDAGSCPFRYQGQYEDAETGLYYNRFRYYSAEEGLYISQDPSSLKGGTVLYGYVNDVNTWIDPFGLSVSDGVGRDHVTYTGTKIVDGKPQPYTGYASAPSELGLSPQDIIARRYNGDYSAFGGTAPTPIYHGSGAEGKQTARGLEQHNYEADVAKFGKENVANKQNPVGLNNENRELYKEKAEEHLEKKKNGKC